MEEIESFPLETLIRFLQQPSHDFRERINFFTVVLRKILRRHNQIVASELFIEEIMGAEKDFHFISFLGRSLVRYYGDSQTLYQILVTSDSLQVITRSYSQTREFRINTWSEAQAKPKVVR